MGGEDPDRTGNKAETRKEGGDPKQMRNPESVNVTKE